MVRSRRHRRRARAGALALALSLAVASCGGPRVTKPVEDHLYRGLAAPLPHIDATVLRGFSVLIDPGHGGSFRGTVGQDSLEEAQVNLGVALYLWGLLHDAGAAVYLTRASDRDFLTPADSALSSDLQSRVNAADSLSPDVFISVHHNAQPQRDPAVNRVETYYKAGDAASLDLAFSIHRHLMRNLGIDVGEVKQGNYYVLRNVNVPAVLGESSYLTHPPVEQKIRLSRVQQLEAEAYFLGILDYCRRGIPRVTGIGPADSLLAEVPTVTCRFEDRGGLGIDPDGVGMTINGSPVMPLLSADGRSASLPLPWDSPNGSYDVRVTARNLGGNTSVAARKRFSLAHAPAMAAVTPAPAAVPRGGGSVRVRARVLDRRGLPVADGTAVTLTSPVLRGPLTALVGEGAVEFALEVPRGTTRPVGIELECAGVRFARTLPVAPAGGERWRTLVVRDAASGAPIRTARVTFGDSMAASGSPSGAYGFVRRRTEPLVSAPGYRPASADGADTLALAPWFGGVLAGKRFVLDPEGGPARVAGVGPLGLSASHVNLRMAGYLAGYLRAAGAEVRLTRTSEEVRLAEDVVLLVNRYHADRYVEIRHPALPADSASGVRTYFFPGSANGEKMARTLGAEAARLLHATRLGPSEMVTFALQQTPCPAVVVALPPISDREEELRLDRAAYLREQAYALFVGLLRHFGVGESGSLEVEVSAAPRADWTVTLDGCWTLDTGDEGTVRFECVAPGPHDVVLRRGNRMLSRSLVAAGGEARLAVDPDAR